MPIRKAARKSAKKTAKDSISKPAKYLRRAYEHLGRIDILEGALAGTPFVDVTLLANLAEQQLTTGNTRNAAYLLRAAEHLSFAALAPKSAIASVSAKLKTAIDAELKELNSRADEQWTTAEEPDARLAIAELYSRAVEEAERAYRRNAYRPALEFARAAEALSHITDGLPAILPGDRELMGRLAS
jgi:hypothetical protein